MIGSIKTGAFVGQLFQGDDGSPVEEVGAWAKTKHEYLCRYVDISRGVRSKWLDHGKAGATLIDPFCGPGRCRIRGTNEFIDGGVVAAWKKSADSRTPFSAVYIGDIEPGRVEACKKRLQALNAPVVAFTGNAVATIKTVVGVVNPHSLNFAYLDPYNLETLNFEMIRTLSDLRYVDMLVHVSQMDLQRNLDKYSSGDSTVFDAFIPGWRDAIKAGNAKATRQAILRYWSELVGRLGVWPSPEPKLVTGPGNQPLYWLLLAAKHELALAFWKVAANNQRQGNLF
ncbi:MAG: three-Cys-motif partner protein TcmP [Mesorhizobium sp.]|uniref:three-Cys-motif partner protein TcmP n=1 Tax=Mesorhizobium sp. TaxID=1871066 RepID=UPI000FEA3B9F|nr:three-Cys-motif partner protein TcmP [Mesorhizobium sp.]RWP85140.1 MAG: three-Cys-motif partner protein TcmP [Mesorhizobium sp.]